MVYREVGRTQEKQSGETTVPLKTGEGSGEMLFREKGGRGRPLWEAR